MEEQEKQIKEMKDIVHNLWDKLNQDAITTNDIISALYNAGYRKIDKDSVVLSKEEYEILKVKEKEKHWFRTCMSVWENGKIDGSKETAERDFYTIIKALEERKERVKAFYGIAESVGADIAIRTVKELAKQFGVEIKE